MKLYGYYRSSAAFRVRIALNLKGIAYDDDFRHLRKGEHLREEYAAVNPQKLLPALALDDGTVLTQSLAIIEYLDEVHPETPLLPGDPAGRARVRALAMIPACEIHPLQNLRVLKHVRDAYSQDEAGSFAWARHWNEVGLAAYEAMLGVGQVEGRYSHGDTPTLADICLVPQIFGAKRFSAALDRFPRLMRVFDACMQLDAFDRAQPARQPDFEP